MDQRLLIREAIRVARPGGTVLFSSCSGEFWQHRLGWFRIQSECGLVGEITEVDGSSVFCEIVVP